MVPSNRYAVSHGLEHSDERARVFIILEHNFAASPDVDLDLLVFPERQGTFRLENPVFVDGLHCHGTDLTAILLLGRPTRCPTPQADVRANFCQDGTAPRK